MPTKEGKPGAPQSPLAKRRLAGISRSIDGIPRVPAPVRWYWHAVARVENLLHERGVETARYERTLDHFHPEHVHYEPSGWGYLRRVLRRRDVSEDDVFLDIGCGKGRILLQAAGRYRFRRVVGIEIAPELVEVARENLAAAAGRLRTREVEVIQADATRTPIPDDVTVAYMYLPFVGEAFARTIDAIEASLDRAPRRFRLIFCCPLLEDRVTASGRFRLVESFRGRRFRHVLAEIRLYEADGSRRASSANGPNSESNSE